MSKRKWVAGLRWDLKGGGRSHHRVLQQRERRIRADSEVSSRNFSPIRRRHPPIAASNSQESRRMAFWYRFLEVSAVGNQAACGFARTCHRQELPERRTREGALDQSSRAAKTISRNRRQPYPTSPSSNAFSYRTSIIRRSLVCSSSASPGSAVTSDWASWRASSKISRSRNRSAILSGGRPCWRVPKMSPELLRSSRLLPRWAGSFPSLSHVPPDFTSGRNYDSRAGRFGYLRGQRCHSRVRDRGVPERERLLVCEPTELTSHLDFLRRGYGMASSGWRGTIVVG